MASYPQFTSSDLALFSGRGSSAYENAAYVPVAVKQATLLFKLATCLSDFPDDPIRAELAQTAILAMADAIYLSQQYQEVLSNPFSSETIGSYSYSKVAGAVAGGLPTGITWFDLAITQLGVCDLDIPSGGGIEMFEFDGVFTEGQGGNVRFLGPAELDQHEKWLLRDPSPGYKGVQPGTVAGTPSEELPDTLDGGEL